MTFARQSTQQLIVPFKKQWAHSRNPELDSRSVPYTVFLVMGYWDVLKYTGKQIFLFIQTHMEICTYINSVLMSLQFSKKLDRLISWFGQETAELINFVYNKGYLLVYTKTELFSIWLISLPFYWKARKC